MEDPATSHGCSPFCSGIELRLRRRSLHVGATSRAEEEAGQIGGAMGRGSAACCWWWTADVGRAGGEQGLLLTVLAWERVGAMGEAPWKVAAGACLLHEGGKRRGSA